MEPKLAATKEQASSIQAVPENASEQIKYFFRALAICSILAIFIGFIGEKYFSWINFEALALGITVGLLNLLALRLVVAFILGLIQNKFLGALLFLIKLPALILVVWYIAAQPGSYVYSALFGLFLFIPAAFLTAFWGMQDPDE